MLLDTMTKNIKDIINNTTIKFTKYAKDNETVESKQNADVYIAAKLGIDTFRDYSSFSEEVLNSIGLTYPLYDVPAMIRDKTLIPQNRRDELVIAQRQYIINNYVELNDYYRALMGLPNMTDENFVYLSEEQYIYYEVDMNTPVHLIDEEKIYQLENDGVLKEIQDTNSDKLYLKYLGYHKIDPLYSREAQNFDLLNIESDLSDAFYSTFVKTYNECREYCSSELYISAFSSNYDLYDNFIGLCIMFMTIQRLIANAFKFGIQRDFYDWSFIQSMYKMYNIPFIEDLSMEYHVIIVKNLNKLLRFRSTDKVLLDICEMLGNEHLNIYRFYMIKQHKLDANEKPIFVYKSVDNGDGGTSLVLDNEKTYDVYFQAVNIKETNIPLALTNTYNRKEYTELIENDPYWVDDENTRSLMYDSQYNYVETKYVGLNIMYKMTKMIFEVTYFNRMIIDAKDKLDSVTILLPKVYSDKPFKLFDIIIFMACLICKKNGYESSPITSPTLISHVLGFNFTEENLSYIKDLILKHKDVFDQSLVTDINNIKFNTAEDVNNSFVILKELYDYVVDAMYNAHSMKEYELCKTIIEILHITENQNSIFFIPDVEDGHIAETYEEYLAYRDPILVDVLNSTTIGKISAMLDHIIAKINDSIPSLLYFYNMNDASNSPLFVAITSLLRFFKSFSVDLADFNITYIFDSKYFNTIRCINHVSSIVGIVKMSDTMLYPNIDDIYKFSVQNRYSETEEVTDDIFMKNNIKVNSKFVNSEKMKIVWDN
jgi:hypothetical protein